MEIVKKIIKSIVESLAIVFVMFAAYMIIKIMANFSPVLLIVLLVILLLVSGYICEED